MSAAPIGSGATRPTVRPRAFYRGSGIPGVGVDRNPGAADRLPPDPKRSSWRSWRKTVVWTAAWEALRHLPEPAAFGLAAVAGEVAHWSATSTRERVRANLARVVSADELDDVVRTAFRSYARYWVESFRAADISVDAMHARTTTSGFAHLDGVLDEGRGAIVLLAHHGSWDMAARWAESHDYHLAVVAEVLRPRQLFERFVKLREGIGLEVVPLARRANVSEEGRGGIAGRLGQVLDANHLVGLLTDRDLSGRAPVTNFFGAPTRIPVGAAVLACRKKAPIVPITMLQRPRRRWHLHIFPPIEPGSRSVRSVHADVVDALEEIIRLDPTQWHAFQPMWGPVESSTADAGAGEGGDVRGSGPSPGPPEDVHTGNLR